MEARIPGSTVMARYSGTHRTQATDAKQQSVSAPAVDPAAQRVDDGISTQRQPVAADRGELEAMVSEMNEVAQAADRDIAFELDDDSGRVVVSVKDCAICDVFRQLPSEVALELAAYHDEHRNQHVTSDVRY